jgi:hypothetical protein
LVRVEPSVFSVGGVQSSVAVPVEPLLGGLPVTGVVDPVPFDATGVEFDGGVALFDVGVVLFDGGVELFDAGAVTWVVLVATSDERSIRPTLGDTRESEVVDAAAEALDPASEPQAARPNVTRVHNTTLPMCERAAKARFLIDHYPGCVNQSPGQRDFTRPYDPRSPAAIRMTATLLVCRQPRYLDLIQLETGGFASPSCDGFALASWAVDLIETTAAIV